MFLAAVLEGLAVAAMACSTALPEVMVARTRGLAAAGRAAAAMLTRQAAAEVRALSR